MARKKAELGVWAFMIGLVVAVVLGVMPELLTMTNTVIVLGALGIIVGLMNVGDRELQRYLIANIAFLVASAALLAFVAAVPAVGAYLAGIVGNVALFVAPGAAIIGIKEIYEVARA